MENMTKLQSLVEQIHEIEDAYGELHRIINNQELTKFIRKITLCEKYDLKMSDFYDRGTNLQLRQLHSYFNFNIITCPQTWCTNRTTGYRFNKNEDYIVFTNGNTGRLSIATVALEDYPKTDKAWRNFQNKILSFNPVEYDNTNSIWIFTIEDGIKLYKNFTSIFKESVQEFRKILTQIKIERLETESENLKEQLKSLKQETEED